MWFEYFHRADLRSDRKGGPDATAGNPTYFSSVPASGNSKGTIEYPRQDIANHEYVNTLIDAGDARGRRHRDTAGGHEERGVRQVRLRRAAVS
jgi:hypothetical protein